MQILMTGPSRVRMELRSILTLLGAVIKTCMKLTNVERTVENS